MAKISRLVLFLFGYLLSLVSASAETLEWTNPIVPQRADPHCYLHTDGYYYLAATVPEYDRIDIRRSQTIAGLTNAEPVTVWRKHSRGEMGHHIWAPEIHFIDGKWYIYFAAGEAENIWRIRMYVLECDSMNPLTGDWTEKGEIKTKWDTFSLDSSTFEHKGIRYLVWAQKDPDIEGNTNIYIAEMARPWRIKSKQVMLTKPEYDWEKVRYMVNEGPAFFKGHGKVFLAYSAAGTGAEYCLGLLWADENADLMDPDSWTKSLEPVFTSSEASSQYGTGHGNFTTTKDGKTIIHFYHARPYKEIQGDPLANPDRSTRAQILEWDENGMPVFGTPVPDGPYKVEQ